MAEQVAALFQQASSPDKIMRVAAEQGLNKAKVQPGYALLLTQLVSGQDATTSFSAAIHFKNLVKFHWVGNENSDFVIGDQDKAAIKQCILDLLLATPERVRAQLAAALTIISSHELNNWPQLVPSLVAKLQAQDVDTVHGVLHVAHSIFKSFRHQFKSDALFAQIRYVVDTFAPTFLGVCGKVGEWMSATAQQQDQQVVSRVYSTALLASKVFYDLNFQDLPDFFEDNINQFMQLFHLLLSSTHPVFANQSDIDTPTVQIRLHAAVCENLNLYLEKYDEEFTPFLEQLLKSVWTLVVQCGPEPMFDPLVVTASKFLTTVATSPSHRLFGAEGVLQQVCMSIVVPNMRLRDADEELFEFDAEEYVRMDIEGSDLETRRRAVHDLVKGLTKYFEAPVTSIFTQFVGAELQRAYKDESDLCRTKDMCMYLVTAVAAKNMTAAAGAKDVNSLVDIVDFFKQHVIPELKSPLEQRPILKASSLKFTATFRAQLSSEMANEIMTSAMALLRSENEVVHSYAANLIDKMLAMKVPSTNQPVFGKDVVKPIAGQLLTELFGVMEENDLQENDYVMKAITRIARILRQDMVAHVEMCIKKLQLIVVKVCNNPQRPVFNHYMFECIACLVHSIVVVQPESAAAFEKILFESFQGILEHDVADFVPYVIQMLALLVEVRPKPLPATYMNLLPSFLNVTLYERPGNVPPLAGLLSAYLHHAADHIVGTQQLSGILGVFQFLVSKKAHDHDGLQLLRAVFDHIPLDHLSPLLKQVFQILLVRMQSSSSGKYERNLCVTLLSLCAKHGGGPFVDSLESIQAGLTGQILSHVIVKRLTQVGAADERRLVGIGCTRLLCDTPQLLTNQSAFRVWPAVVVEMVKLLELPPTAVQEDEEAEMAAVEAAAVSGQPGMVYSKLHFAHVNQQDPFANFPPAKEFFAKSLGAVAKSCPGQVPQAIQSLGADPSNVLPTLQGYLAAVGVSI